MRVRSAWKTSQVWFYSVLLLLPWHTLLYMTRNCLTVQMVSGAWRQEHGVRWRQFVEKFIYTLLKSWQANALKDEIIYPSRWGVMQFVFLLLFLLIIILIL